MSAIEDIQKLIFNHTRRLQVLKEQQALEGRDTPPAVLLEIEDIEAKLEELKDEWAELAATAEREQSPLVYVHNYGDRPQEIPAGAHLLDWSEWFEARVQPRKIPPPEVWQSKLLPELSDLPARLGGPGLIRLQGTGALSTGVALGSTFKEIGRYLLEVSQYSAGKTQLWYSDEEPPAGETAPHFADHIFVGNPAATDGVIIIYAAPKQSLEDVVRSVGVYWGEAEVFAASLGGAGASEQFKGVLVLEAEAASRQGRDLQSWEAAVLARESAQQLAGFINQVNPQKLHLFLAVPFGLAIFLGHQWNALGKKVQCYEWVGGDRVYAPACELGL